jgi:hypothetical protein
MYWNIILLRLLQSDWLTVTGVFCKHDTSNSCVWCSYPARFCSVTLPILRWLPYPISAVALPALSRYPTFFVRNPSFFVRYPTFFGRYPACSGPLPCLFSCQAQTLTLTLPMRPAQPTEPFMIK